MSDPRTIPNTDQLSYHAVPPTVESSGPNYQNIPTPGQSTRTIIPNCSCPWCSDAQPRPPPTVYHTEQQQPRNSIVDQHCGEGNRFVTAMNGPDHTREYSLAAQAMQAVGVQDNSVIAPVRDRAGPSNIGFPQAPTVEALIAEGRRRLAGRYIYNPDAFVSMIRLEPSPSGQFQVIITVEMANIL